MARPGILRADTLELQDHEAPSAKSHIHPQHNQQQQDDAWGSGRSSHEGSELLDEDSDFLTDGGAVPMDLRVGRDAAQHSATNRSSEDSDMTDGDDDAADDDLVDKISSSPSIGDDEDIDFEFVYALHTFVATVEGQANATKGDTMVLLDDSNSYWWLVRVVKDSSIGYLPAEHIETPTERLARLNKHRNADLAQQMLTDTSEKSKNPLKKAMRRRNAKMVQFTAPTYYEASDVEWSDEDDERDGGDMDLDARHGGEAQHNGDDSTGKASTDASGANGAAIAGAAHGAATADPSTEQARDAPNSTSERDALDDAAAQERGLRIDPEQANREAFEGKDIPSISKNGNIRNTDSFFKDDTAEPKKMSLTPTLLRDSENAIAESPRTSESHGDPSPIQDTFDQLDKSTSPTSDKFKDERKKKEKKPGMLSGLFKRKEKKIKVDEAAGGTVRSSKDGEALLGSPTSSPGETATITPRERSPQATRKSSGNKLVKSPPQSVANSNAASAAVSGPSSGVSSPPNGAAKPAPLSPNISTGGTSPSSQTSGEQRGLAPPTTETANGKPQGLRVATGGSPTEKKEGGLLSPLSNLLPQSDQPRKEKLKKAKQRMDLDVDSSPERDTDSPVVNNRNASHTPPPRQGVSTVHSEPYGDEMVSPVDKHPPSFDSSGNLRSYSPVSRSPTPTETASTVQTPQTESEAEPKTSTAASSTVPDHHTTLSTDLEGTADTQWDDVALRGYLDARGHDDVKDLLIRVHDRSEVVPLPDNHPTMLEFGFHETEAQLATMSAHLDQMLHGFLARSTARKTAREAVAAPTATATTAA